jgi:hypothetical protein
MEEDGHLRAFRGSGSDSLVRDRTADTPDAEQPLQTRFDALGITVSGSSEASLGMAHEFAALLS